MIILRNGEPGIYYKDLLCTFNIFAESAARRLLTGGLCPWNDDGKNGLTGASTVDKSANKIPP
jgi:hypothetical protein